RGHARVVPGREELEGEDRFAALRREAEHVGDSHRLRFSLAEAVPSTEPRRRRRVRRLERCDSSPVAGAAGPAAAAAPDAAPPGTLQGVSQSERVNASITLPAMSFTRPPEWQPHTWTVA